MSQKVILFQIFGTKLRLPFMFGFGSDSERLSEHNVHLREHSKHVARALRVCWIQQVIQDRVTESLVLNTALVQYRYLTLGLKHFPQYLLNTLKINFQQQTRWQQMIIHQALPWPVCLFK